MSLNLDFYERKIINHFNKKKVYNLGFLKYGYFARRIAYLFKSTLSNYELRKIFNNLVSKGYFHKQQNIKKSYIFEYINFKTKNYYNSKQLTIIFD